LGFPKRLIIKEVTAKVKQNASRNDMAMEKCE